jgi:hypothetical protein
MTSIQIKTIEGHGPYAYRVEWSGDGDSHEWEYLGPVGRIDPDELTDDEIEELREELDQDPLDVYEDAPEADFVHLEAANSTRDEIIDRWGPEALDLTDDRRLTEIQLSTDAPRGAVRQAQAAAQDDQRSSDPGQSPLTDSERNRIDFSKGNSSVPHARTAKSAIQGEGVSDWTSLYDPQIEDPSQFSEIARDNRDGMSGDRIDEAEAEGAQAADMSLEQAESQLERRALEGAREGYEEARTALEEDFGYSEEEIAAVTQEAPA